MSGYDGEAGDPTDEHVAPGTVWPPSLIQTLRAAHVALSLVARGEASNGQPLTGFWSEGGTGGSAMVDIELELERLGWPGSAVAMKNNRVKRP